MGYLFLSVVFYTVVKYGFDTWSALFYVQQATDRDYGFDHGIRKLEEKVITLRNRVDVLEATETEDDVV